VLDLQRQTLAGGRMTAAQKSVQSEAVRAAASLPWRLGGQIHGHFDILDAQGAVVALSVPPEHAERIVQCVNAHDDLAALHQRHVDGLLEIAHELRLPRLPLATVAAISVRQLAEMAQESLDAIAKAGAA
jgi:hypothetical protein